MDIKFNTIQSVGSVQRYQGTQRTNAANKYGSTQQASDKVDFSDSGKLFANAMKQAMNTPEVREEKIAALREQIQNGTYAPDGKDIAKKMLSNLGL